MSPDCWLDYHDLLKAWEWFEERIWDRDDEEWGKLTMREDDSWLGEDVGE